jgi:hypothetical protein
MLDRLSDAQTMLSRLDSEYKCVVLILTDGYFRNACGEPLGMPSQQTESICHITSLLN